MKEFVKNAASGCAFAGGIFAGYRLLRENSDRWETAFRISCVVSALASRPVWNFLPRGDIFEVNPWHLRHVISVIANIFASISLVKLVVDRRFSSPTHMIVFFNFCTGRPVLHLANNLRLY